MRRFKRPTLLPGQQIKPQQQQEPIRIPDAPVVPTSNMRLPDARNQPMGAAGGGGLSGAPMQAQAMGNKGPMTPFRRQTPSVEDIWSTAEGFGEGPSTINPKDLGRELEDDLSNIGHGSQGPQETPDAGIAPGEEAPEELPPGYGTTDYLANEALKQLLSGDVRDTSEDEALIRELLQSTVGQGQADLNARMAAGGFGTSGALGALSGDMRANAARKSAQEIMGVRQSARDEWLDRTMAGIEAEFKDRGMDLSEEQFNAYLNMIKQMADVEETPGTGDTITEEEEQEFNNPYTSVTGMAPIGGEYLGSDDKYDYYTDVTGRTARVRKT